MGLLVCRNWAIGLNSASVCGPIINYSGRWPVAQEHTGCTRSSWTEFFEKGLFFDWRMFVSSLAWVDQSVLRPINHDRMPSDDEQDLLKTPPASTNNELPPDFDAGINTSAAWTESRDKDRSLSDEETDPNDPELDYLQTSGRPARALYSFEGKPEFREVCVSAGDEIEVMREEVGDGWSLVKLFIEGGVELGLLPRSYYTVCLNVRLVSCTEDGPVHCRLCILPIS